ncbi:MAG: (2Fe-2S)-binding protein [Bdellovibrionaceae bacterium]|nr:(2Fe-2S)-binding protein [Pseudobdellovibrionaceae bacterium]
MAELIKIERKIPGREEVLLVLELDQEKNIKSAQLKALGPLKFLQLINKWRGLLIGPLTELSVPNPVDTGSMLLREVILKAKGQWLPPYTQLQICHCRSVPTAKVEEAILVGAHSAESVSRMTSASTACGTCQPDVKDLIEYMTQFETDNNSQIQDHKNKKVA